MLAIHTVICSVGRREGTYDPCAKRAGHLYCIRLLALGRFPLSLGPSLLSPPPLCIPSLPPLRLPLPSLPSLPPGASTPYPPPPPLPDAYLPLRTLHLTSCLLTPPSPIPSCSPQARSITGNKSSSSNLSKIGGFLDRTLNMLLWGGSEPQPSGPSGAAGSATSAGMVGGGGAPPGAAAFGGAAGASAGELTESGERGRARAQAGSRERHLSGGGGRWWFIAGCRCVWWGGGCRCR